MTRWEWNAGVVVPVIGIFGYFLGLWLAPAGAFHRIVLSEQGVIELGTAAFYVAAAALAVALASKARGSVPQGYRVLYILFALAALFVALEELSYGQHLLGWESPEWFAAHNTKRETNLHNLLESKPGRMLYDVGHVIFPIGCIVVPLATMRRRGAYAPGHWSFYLLPRAQLMTVVILAGLLGLVRKVAPMEQASIAGLGELVEFYWGLAALLYVGTLWQRLILSDRTAQRRVLAA